MIIDICFLLLYVIGRLNQINMIDWGNEWLDRSAFVTIEAPILESQYFELRKLHRFRWEMPKLTTIIIHFIRIWNINLHIPIAYASGAFGFSDNLGTNTPDLRPQFEWVQYPYLDMDSPPPLLCFIHLTCKIPRDTALDRLYPLNI